jgi:nicotinamidase-related amidase
MASLPVRDPVGDHLLTPENAALAVIDYQPSQFGGVNSIDRDLLLEDNPPIDRTTTNAWEDAEFLVALRATGRRKLILCALRTEICMAFPALDALREGYDVYPVVDAIGGTSDDAHRAGPDRVVQAGAQL